MPLAPFIATLAAGSALLAVWSYVRWPNAAPASLGRAVGYAIAGFVGLQVAVAVLGAATSVSEALAPLAVVGVVVPTLTAAMVTALWVMRLFAAALDFRR